MLKAVVFYFGGRLDEPVLEQPLNKLPYLWIPLVFGFEYPIGEDAGRWSRAADKLFSFLNKDDRPYGRVFRSMCVNDMVIFFNSDNGRISEVLRCAATGWHHLRTEALPRDFNGMSLMDLITAAQRSTYAAFQEP